MTDEELLNVPPGLVGERLLAEERELEERWYEQRAAEKRERRRLAYEAEQRSVEVKHTEPVRTVVTKAAPAASRGLSRRDIALAEAAGKIAGELAGKTRRELDAELAILKAEVAELRREMAALKGPGLRSVA